MLRITFSLFIVLFSIQSFAADSKEYTLQTWSCAKSNALVNPELKNLKFVTISQTETQRIVALHICDSTLACKIITHHLKDWNQTSGKITGWSQDENFMYDFTVDFNSEGKAEKIEVYTSYIHYDGDDECVGSFEM